MAQDIAIELTGTKLDGVAGPAVFGELSRSAAGGPDDEFIPASYVKVQAAYEVGAASRSAGETVGQQVAAEQVVLLELADGSTLITSAARLRSALQRNRPDLLDAQGAILIDRFQEEGAVARGAPADLVRKVFLLTVGAAEDSGGIIGAARAKLAGLLGLGEAEGLQRQAELGVSWLGTKALMWAIEQKVGQRAGTLHAWTAQGLEEEPWAGAAQPVPAAPAGPMLVFIHGTASNTLGSFGDLHGADGRLWSRLEKAHPGGVFAFEHRTLSESPIDNALQLAQALPAGARVHLVTHSRGGLVGDLLCLQDLQRHIEGYRYAFRHGVGALDLAPGQDADAETRRIQGDMADQHQEQREQLKKLARLLADKDIAVERYVRAASPAQGTKLASANFDVFLSGILSLIGVVPALAASPVYRGFKRVVLEIAKNRTNPHLVPGIEAMLPDAPMAALLRDATPRPGTSMAVLAGDIEGGSLLQRLGVMLTDYLLFDAVDNDLVVHTEAMLGGVAAKTNARVLFDRGAGVSHFRYFLNLKTRSAVEAWLTDARPEDSRVLQPLPARFQGLDALGVMADRGVGADLPVVVLLPGIMGSYLDAGGKRIWFDLLKIAGGKLADIAWSKDVSPTGVFDSAYGRIARHLAATHRVKLFPYDWRQPMDVLGDRLGTYLETVLAETSQPVRLLAHSMGGLVVRACIHRRRPVMDALMQREGARLITLGTPHQGSHAMVENLLGKGDMVRNLARLDQKQDLQKVLDIVGGFRGALQLLPKPGFSDVHQGDENGGEHRAYGDAATWLDLKGKNTDFWFGDQRCSVPDPAALASGSWLWERDGLPRPALPDGYKDKAIHVHGVARNTPCGVRFQQDAKPPRLRMVGTTAGDGTVTWKSGHIDGVGAFYYMPGVAHGDLLDADDHFDAIVQLLSTGVTAGLATSAPTVRDAVDAPVLYDPPPPAAVDEQSVAASIMGSLPSTRMAVGTQRTLKVQVKAMDLRFLNDPVMVGHYQSDPIAGPERIIDLELLDRELSQRHDLGLYPGALGTAMAVLRAPSALEQLRGSTRGAVVTGLGVLNGTLGFEQLKSAVRAGVLRYLLHTAETQKPRKHQLTLATLLLGQNSAANLSIAASIEALVRGVAEGNARFHEATKQDLHVDRLDIVELYLDTAITAAYELREAQASLAAFAAQQGAQLDCASTLVQGEGLRPRLFAASATNYWPRLIVSARDQGRMHFLVAGQRARAESLGQDRQPGLVEGLVAQQITNRAWSPDFSNMLFQLVMPHDLKGLARGMQRMVLVVDEKTADLPWEMMLPGSEPGSALPGNGDDEPLAVRAPLVRQLESEEYRRQVSQGITAYALVIGDPSVRGFRDHFEVKDDPRQLPGADAEARAVAGILERHGYEVTKVIGSHNRASTVLAQFLRSKKPFRILHISAHGVFEQRRRGCEEVRSGVVLSDGVLITVAEIRSMESVPELVFLNCCHLGRVDQLVTVENGNRLAASIARELIRNGVRCVVAAGWAVTDSVAQHFGEVFYDQLLLHGRPFGDAVHAARKAAWKEQPRDITWGAFQAYGDPDWRAEPGTAGNAQAKDEQLVSPDELLDELSRVRSDTRRQFNRLGPETRKPAVDGLTAFLKARCPPGWLALPYVRSALGQTWRELECMKEAAREFEAAIQAEDKLGRVPIRDIEQLANIEARQGEKEDAIALIDKAIRRLRNLDRLVAGGGEASRHAERMELLGSAYKRKAAVLARRLLNAEQQNPDDGLALDACLEKSAAYYRMVEGSEPGGQLRPYPALNRLAIEAVSGVLQAGDQREAIRLAGECRATVSRNFQQNADLWDAIMQPEAELVARLCDGSLGAADTRATAAAAVRDAYEQALKNLAIPPWHFDSVITQLEILADLSELLAGGPGGAEARAVAEELRALVLHLQPGHAFRTPQ